ncbi:MAG: hypothetical protein IT385_08150 [Deltaproteobacteria bacterium]|nr:hypothetical protein [Deltaproteobacteria bacterium]
MRTGILLGSVVALLLVGCGKKETPAADAATVAPPETKPATTAPPETKPPETTAPPETKPPETAAPTTPPPETKADEDAGTAPADDAAAPTAADDAAAPTAAEEVAGAEAHAYQIAVAAPAKPFRDMSDEEKGTYMKEVVVPAMRERFQHFDGEEFAKVNCATCHGPNPKDRKFEMPNPESTKLPTTMEGFEKLMAKEPKAVEFMGDVVVPTMATLLGEEPFNPETGKGFGCFVCHMKEE